MVSKWLKSRLPAVGGHSLRDSNNAPQFLFSSLDLPAHKKLKFRQKNQNSNPSINAQKEKLLIAEHLYYNSKKLKLSENPISNPPENNPDADSDIEGIEDADADMISSKSSESEDDSEDEDDTADLLRELEKIKRERAMEKERVELEKMQHHQNLLEEQAKSANPLLNLTQSSATPSYDNFTSKKRWDDDVIFRNQARGSERKPEKRFINDLLRSDFHRKFMGKYVR